MRKTQALHIINDVTFQALLQFTPYVSWKRFDDEYADPCKQHSQDGTHPLSWALIQHLATKHGVSDASVDDLYHSAITCTCGVYARDVQDV